MNRDTWNRIKEIYFQAIDLESDERAAFIARACAGDAALQSEVQAFVDAEGPVDGFLESPGVAPLDGPWGTSPASMVGRRIGAYEILRELGRGGMGTVYLAHRADGRFEQEVAIKLIRQGMSSSEAVRRFQSERRTLASLQHPNIARLYDGGVTDDGIHYFAMEHVDGSPIDVHCNAHRLSTNARLELFRKVCGAVHAAHTHLIIHRDLKPANVLIDGNGEPKLLDFGIAKLLESDVGETTAATAATQRPMTVEYASPEQVLGLRMTTQSDVYSLGIVLFELLTGCRPYRFTSRNHVEIARVICETDAERPSTALWRTRSEASATDSDGEDDNGRFDLPGPLASDVSPRRLAGDLDNIVLMALQKEPDRRYASVEQFSEDIRRHLVKLPIRARRDTIRYRAARLVQRNKLAVAAAIALTATLLLGIASTAWKAAEARRERDLANASLTRAVAAEQRAQSESARAAIEADAAKETAAFLVGLFGAADPDAPDADAVTARQMLDRGAEKIQAELADQPAIRATLLNTLGAIYSNLAAFDRAHALFEEALALQRDLYGARSLEAAERLNDLGLMQRALGKFAESVESLREALSIRREHLGEHDPVVAQSLSNLGLVLHELGAIDEAEDVLRSALEIRRDAFGTRNEEVAATLNNLGVLLFSKGDYHGARQCLTELVDATTHVFGEEHSRTALTKTNLGLLLHVIGEYEAAERLYTEALAVQRSIYGTAHPELAATVNNLGGLCIDRGQPAAAEAYFREALTNYQDAYGGDHPKVARAMSNIGLSLRRQGRFDGAEPLLRDALAICRGGLPPGHPDIAATLCELGTLMYQTERIDDGEDMLREALSIREAALPPGHWRIAESESALGECLIEQGRLSEAESLLVSACAVLQEKRGSENAFTRDCELRLARLRHAGEEKNVIPTTPPAARPAGDGTRGIVDDLD